MEKEKFINILFRLANDDLKSSQVLYINKLYPESIFFLQQAVEKSTKGFGLSLGLINSGELIKIGHNSTAVYQQMLNGILESYKKLNDLPSMSPLVKDNKFYKSLNISETYKNLTASIDHLSNLKKMKPNDIVASEIDEFIREVKLIDSYKTKDIAVKPETLEKVFDDLFNFSSLFDKTRTEEVKKKSSKIIRDERFILALRQTIPFMIDLSYTLNTFFFMSIILFPHSVDSRYPSKERNHNPYQLYKKNNVLIRKHKELTTVLKKAIYKAKKLSKVIRGLSVSKQLV